MQKHLSLRVVGGHVSSIIKVNIIITCYEVRNISSTQNRNFRDTFKIKLLWFWFCGFGFGLSADSIFGFRKVLGLVKNGFGFLPTRPNNTKVTWSCVFFEIFIFQFCSVGIVKNFKLWFYLGPEKGPLNGWSSFLKFLHFILFSNLQMMF